MEISSDLPQVGTNKLSVDFNYINSASKVTLDDSFLNSLRVSNGTFFTIAPKVGSIDLKNEVKWTVGITMRSDKYLTDDDI